MIDIKDYIIKGELPEKEEKAVTFRSPTEYIFSIEYENDTDFIMKRKTKKTEKLLVCLISQAQIYIKDVKQNTIDNVTEVSQIKEFKKGMKSIPYFKKLTWTPFKESYWSSNKISITTAFENVIQYKDEVKFLANKKYKDFTNISYIFAYKRDPESFNKRNEVIKTMRLVDESFDSHVHSYDTIQTNILNSKIDYNTIKNSLEIIEELTFADFLTILRDNMFSTCVLEYRCDFKTLLQYILYTIKYRNSLEIGSYYGFKIYEYADYLRMQQEMYGKIKEKYPLYWLSEKQMMINKYNKWKELRRIEGFTLGQEKLKTIEYEDEVYKVIIPLKNTDILDEAQQQQHCVASYIDRISKGETHIVFIRQKLNEEESCLTVQITPDLRIIQVRGFQNRNYTGLEYSFMRKWAEDKNLKLEVPEVV